MFYLASYIVTVPWVLLPVISKRHKLSAYVLAFQSLQFPTHPYSLSLRQEDGVVYVCFCACIYVCLYTCAPVASLQEMSVTHIIGVQKGTQQKQ